MRVSRLIYPILIAIGLIILGVLVVKGQNPNVAIYPGAVATDQNLLAAQNFGSNATLAGSINASVTTFTISSGTQYRSPAALVIDQEIIECNTLSSGVYSNCTRGFDGTSAASHNSGVIVYGSLVAWHHNQVAAEIKAIEGNILQILVNGTAIAVRHALNFNVGTGASIACNDNSGSNRVDCNIGINAASVMTPTNYQAGAYDYCKSINGTTNYTCNPTTATYTNGYTEGMRVFLRADTTCSALLGCALNINNQGNITIKENDGVTNPGTSLIMSRGYWLWYDGTIFRTEAF